jgi:CRP/FNR family cyclic AMP-dependent transcriptional regulator
MRLEIYMSSQNATSWEPLLIAKQASQIPGLEVNVIDLEKADQLPPSVDRIPAYVLDSQVISLDQSSLEEFLSRLRWQAQAQRNEHPPPARRPRSKLSAASPHEATSFKTSQNCHSLMTIDIFCDLSEKDISSLCQHMSVQTYSKGQIIYLQQEHAQGLFLLRQGRVQIYRLTASGKRLELATIDPGTFFGEVPLLGEALHHASAEAMADSVIGVISRSNLEQLILEWPSIALRMISELSRRIAINAARLEELAYQSAPARLAAELLRLRQGHIDNVVSVTHQELGDMTGMLRETVTKMLNEFRAAGFVELRRGRILLLDVAGLETLLRDSDAAGSRRLTDLAAS